MEKWSLEPAPTAADERRHILRFQGEMKDVVQILKRFGAICGRPDRSSIEPGYNFKLFLNKPAPEVLENLSTFLGELVPAPSPSSALEGAVPSTTEVAGPPPAEEPAPSAVEEPPPPAPALPEIEIRTETPALEPEPPPAEPPPSPVPEAPVPSSPEVAGPTIEQLPLAESTVEPAPGEPPPEPPPVLPPIEQLPLTEPVAEAPPAAAPLVAVQAAQRAAKPLWGLERSLDEKRNFDALLVGSYNRFAHAAATSVVGSPGSMYNPLFIHGGPGVGKTHMLNAIGGGLAKTISPENVLVTSGTRLSSAVAQALVAGRMAEIEGLVAKKKCLLVDDLHLLAASEASQGPLGKLFNHFLGQNLQVVITSLYPPRALAALEEALKISFAKGSAVEMKAPGLEPQKDMVLAGFSRYATDLNNDENAVFHEKLSSNYFESIVWIRRLLALKKMREAAGKQGPVGDLVGELFVPVTTAPGADMPTAADLEKLKGFSAPSTGPSARSLAVLYPKGSDALANWMICRFYGSAAEVGASQDYRHVLVDSYDPEQPFGVPFQIGEMCRLSGAEAALILGPSSQSKLSERAAEFTHAVKHILADQDVALGWIPYAATTSPTPFFHAHLDFAAQWSLPPCE